MLSQGATLASQWITEDRDLIGKKCGFEMKVQSDAEVSPFNIHLK